MHCGWVYWSHHTGAHLIIWVRSSVHPLLPAKLDPGPIQKVFSQQATVMLCSCSVSDYSYSCKMSFQWLGLQLIISFRPD